MPAEHIVLAGGGHTHALLLRRWIMNPKTKPKGLVTLINRDSTTFYSGMIPGLISGYYKIGETLINLRNLADQAGVAFVKAEIVGINFHKNCLFLENRPPIYFQKMSLDVGSQTLLHQDRLCSLRQDQTISIKSLNELLNLLISEDEYDLSSNAKPFNIIGAGFAGVEIAFALRQRWKKRPIKLHVRHGQPIKQLRRRLKCSKIELY